MAVICGTAGLTILCKGSRDDKVKSAFALYDCDGSGYISFEEMRAYLTSVFVVLFKTSPETQESIAMRAQVRGLEQFDRKTPSK